MTNHWQYIVLRLFQRSSILHVIGCTICTISHDAETFAHHFSLKIVFLPITVGFVFQMLLMLDRISFSFRNICPSHVSEPLDSQPLNVHPDPLHWVSKTAVCKKKSYITFNSIFNVIFHVIYTILLLRPIPLSFSFSSG